jgi:nuclear transport factor 2 (NTF2) superfamily protein
LLCQSAAKVKKRGELPGVASGHLDWQENKGATLSFQEISNKRIAKNYRKRIEKRSNAMATQPQVSLVPPFTRETAAEKVRKAEDAWNTRDPQRVALAYTVDCRWRNRAEFVNGREEIVQFLTRKWNRELDYRLIKELWAFDGARIAVRFAYEWHDDSGQFYRSYGNENWEFNAEGVMHHRYASINDLPIRASEALFHWPLGRRPDGHPGLSELGL